MSEKVSPVRTGRAEVVEQIVAVARRAFAEDGVSATRMEDISRSMGMTRQNLYRYVSGRDELVELVIAQRVGELGERLTKVTEALDGDLREDFVTMLIAAIEAGRDDDEFGVLAEALPRAKLNVLLASATSPVFEFCATTFSPLLRRAYAADRLRTEVSLDQMVEWLQEMVFLYVPRVDLGEDALRLKMETFVLRGVLK